MIIDAGTEPRVLRLGAIGLGRAFASMAPSLIEHPRVKLVAAVDPNEAARRHCARDFGASVYADAEALFTDTRIDAVYIATPHELHVPQTLRALESGKHVLLEKPMAMNLRDCQRLVDASERDGLRLVVGHSHGFDAPFREAARLIASGRFGPIRMVNALNYTNWIYRPRRPEELAPSSAGVALNQASHQIDVVRLLAGGVACAVRASAGAWDADRPTIGAYSALLQFEGSVCALLNYSGYDHFDSDEFNGWISELGRRKTPAHGAARRQLRETAAGRRSEVDLKAGVGYAGMVEAPEVDRVDLVAQWHQQFGLIIVSCERADLRIGARGITVYDGDGAHHLSVPPPASGGARAGVFDELYEAVLSGRPTLHSGRWAMANLEVCLAMIESARTRREVVLQHQCPAADQGAPLARWPADARPITELFTER